MTPRILAVMAMLVLSGGAGAADAVAASPPAPSARAPITVKWLTRQATPGRLELTARVMFNAPFGERVSVSVSVPPGVQLLKGPASFLATAPPGLGAVDTDYGFGIPAGSVGDLVVTVDLQGPGFGVHAKDVHTVGRPSLGARKAVQVVVSAPPVNVNRIDLGPPTPLGR